LRILTGATMFTGTQSKKSNDAVCEQLEARQLLAATLVNGVLTVVGSDGSDSISVSLVSGNANQVQVDINGTVNTFNLSAINRIVMHGCLGDDHLFVDNSFGNFPLGVFMKGGAGDDLLEGSEFIDQLLGGVGDDLLKGFRGGDFLFGQEGLDELVGAEGIDKLLGGSLDDLLEGGLGNDILKGGLGDDLLHGDDGLDFIFGGAGLDRLFGDLGDDFLFGGLGDDDLDGGAGLDELVGGLGNDDFVWNKLVELIDNAVEDLGDNINDIFT
jgi:Ca2+-binding RTX toxin-like protein